MAEFHVLGISKKPFLGWFFRVCNQAIAQASALNALCFMVINTSDSWRVENCFRGAVMES
jgi:hypothetical protein